MKQTQTLKQRVYNEVIDSIVRGQFKAGQILTEQELVARYGVSKSPVREALTVLSSEGILSNIPRYGYQVFSFTLEKVADIMEFRAVLEDYLLCRAAENIRPGDLDRLRQLLECQQTEGSVWEHWQSNEDFHLQLASLARNEYCCQQLERSMRLLKLAYAQFYWSQWNRTSIPNDLKNHIRIIEALEDRDLDLARLYLKQDLKDFCME